MEIKNWSVAVKESDMRLDAFARRCLPHLSRREILDAIGQKLFWINERAGKKGQKLNAGDLLTFRGPPAWLLDHPSPCPQLVIPIVYEDMSLLVLDKPAGIPTHGFSGLDHHTVANFLIAQRPSIGTVGKNRWEPGLVHRLDRETSGLLLVAKTQTAFDNLKRQFRRRQIKKRYRTLVWGSTETEGSIAYPIAHAGGDKRRMKAVVNGKVSRRLRYWRALTRYRKLEAFGQFSFLEIEMETGVTHQIRVHLAAISHPIVGDNLYGREGTRDFNLRRHFLHACSLEFSHPANDRAMRVESELPQELSSVLAQLRLET